MPPERERRPAAEPIAPPIVLRIDENTTGVQSRAGVVAHEPRTSLRRPQSGPSKRLTPSERPSIVSDSGIRHYTDVDDPNRSMCKLVDVENGRLFAVGKSPYSKRKCLNCRAIERGRAAAAHRVEQVRWAAFKAQVDEWIRLDGWWLATDDEDEQ